MSTPGADPSSLRRDLRCLWATRRSSGFPWPFGHREWRWLILGYPSWCVIPVWKQVLTIPLRPWRYLRMVRGIAYARGQNFQVEQYDNVP